MENAISVINSFPATRQEREIFCFKVLQEIESGYYNPLDVECQLKLIEKAIETIRKNESFKNHVAPEIDKEDKIFTRCGVTFEKSSKTTYKYDNDAEWVRLNKELKERESMLKACKEPMVIEETGEIINPPITSVSEFIKLSK